MKNRYSGLMGVISNVIIAVFASVIAVLIFQGVQYAFFSEVIKDVVPGNYTEKGITISITNVTSDRATIYIPKDKQACSLRERESCYSGCHRITVVDIKDSVVDIDVVDDILCEVQRSAYDFGKSLIYWVGEGKERVTNFTSKSKK